MTQINTNERDDDMLAAEYVIGVLPTAERITFAHRLASSAALQAKVRSWEENFISLTDEIIPAQAPRHVLQNIESRLFAKTEVPQNWVRNLAFWRGLSFVSLAAFAVAIALYFQQPKILPGTGGNYVAELSAPNDAIKLVTYYDDQTGQIKFNRVAGTPAPGRAFELWLIQGKNSPVSLGVLPASTTGSIALSVSLKMKLAGSVLAISDEPPGGSPTGQPTGAVLATGLIHAI